VRGHCRNYVASVFQRIGNLLCYFPIHVFSRARKKELYGSTYNHGVGETKVEWLRVVNAMDLFGREGDIQRLDILLEMLHLPSTDDGEHIRRFVQKVRNSD
jgi:hypothetical protein